MEDNKPEEQEVQNDNNQQNLAAPENKDGVDDTSKQAQKDEIEAPEDPLGSGDEVQVLEEEVEDEQDAGPVKPKKKRRR